MTSIQCVESGDQVYGCTINVYGKRRKGEEIQNDWYLIKTNGAYVYNFKVLK